MANLNASGAQSTFDMTNVGLVAYDSTIFMNPDNFSWATTGSGSIQAIDNDNFITYTGGLPDAGSEVEQVSIDTLTGLLNFDVTITGLSFALTAFLVDDSDATASANTFWKTVLRGNDTITAPASQNATIFGDGLNIEVTGGGSDPGTNDTINGGNGAVSQIIIGGANMATGPMGNEYSGGNDTITTNATGIILLVGDVLSTDSTITIQGGGDTITSNGSGASIIGDVRTFDGSQFFSFGEDRLTGHDGQSDLLVGDIEFLNSGDFYGGRDFLYGRGGVDELYGDYYANVAANIMAGGDDFLHGGGGNDFLFGQEGNDTLVGGSGGDSLDGGSGNRDVASYKGSNAAVTVKLSTGAASGGHADGDTLMEIEGLFGSKHNDKLTGDNISNHLFGDRGNDKLFGENGNDLIVGGKGKDILTGGSGKDLFAYTNKNESGKTSSTRDKIKDFASSNREKIDLSAVDAKSGGGNQAFKFITTDEFSGKKGELRYEKINSNKVIVEADINGNGNADMTIEVLGVGSLQAGDFVL